MEAWSSGLFDCFSDCGICCYGYCCTSCLYGRNAEQIDGSNCCAQCCFWYFLTPYCCCWIIHMPKRQALRQRYGLVEDCNDCAATAFCGPCAICQEARELKFRSAPSGGPPPVLVQPKGGNVYPSLGHPGMMDDGQF